MKTIKGMLLFLVVFVLLTGCAITPGATPATVNPTATTTPVVASPTGIPTTVVPTTDVATAATPTYEPSIAGGDFLAIAVDDLGDGWMRIRTAGNRDNCAWSNQFKFEMTGNIQAQVPHCWEMRLVGTGTVRFEVKADTTGYATSDTLGTGLAFWPSGFHGQYRVSRDAEKTWTAWVELTTGPEGINFPNDTTNSIIIEFKLNDGYMAMPLGEIRNNVLPQY